MCTVLAQEYLNSRGVFSVCFCCCCWQEHFHISIYTVLSNDIRFHVSCFNFGSLQRFNWSGWCGWHVIITIVVTKLYKWRIHICIMHVKILDCDVCVCVYYAHTWCQQQYPDKDLHSSIACKALYVSSWNAAFELHCIRCLKCLKYMQFVFHFSSVTL